VMGC